jgi:GntR family transcriptional regulator/MocR family aminotransferase
MRRLYKRRREALIDALEGHFGAKAQVTGDAAGLHVVVRFRSGAIAARARRQGVQLASTAPYYMAGTPDHEYILRFSSLGERAIREGVRRLAGR